MKNILLCLTCVLLTGCAISPIPKDIQIRRTWVLDNYQKMEYAVQPGDILFRMGEATVAGGAVNFSDLIARLSESEYSHAAIIYGRSSHGILVADVSTYGMELQLLRDWLIKGQSNITIKRVKPEYRQHLPSVLTELNRLVELDVLYDPTFADKDKYYCIEIVDHCYRNAGLPLAPKIKIKDMPGYNDIYFFAVIAKLTSNVDGNTEIVVAGNNEIGLYSSQFLEEVRYD